MELDCTHCRTETIATHAGSAAEEKTGAVSFPIFQTATFRHQDLHETTGFSYSRLQNPTRAELEKTIMLLESGKKAFAFASGMAAVSAVFRLFGPGSHIIMSEDLYGGTYRLANEIYARAGLRFSFVDTTDIRNIEKEINNQTAAVFIETPTNPMMKVADIAAVSSLSRANHMLTIVDNTFLTPYFQKPLTLGADIVVHSGTKFLSGHNDTLAGFVVSTDDKISERLRLIQDTEGSMLAPFDSWLVLRGIKTLAVRLDKQQQTALQIAQWLKSHPLVENVYYAGLPEHEGYAVSCRQSTGFGSMISFTVNDVSVVEKLLSSLRLILFAESLGGVESLITYPMTQTHASIPEEIRNRLGITDTLLRLSVGLESPEDLLYDLEQGLGC